MIEQFEMVARAVGESRRVRILKMLEGRELCVCQIVAVLGLAPATVSKHLAVLKLVGLVFQRKKGRWVYYRLAERAVNPYARPTLRFLANILETDPAVLRDRRRLGEVVSVPPDVLCGADPQGALAQNADTAAPQAGV